MTRAEWKKQILADLEDLWDHMDERQRIEGSAHALGLVHAGCRLILDGEAETLAEGLAQAVLLLTLVREACLEHEARGEAASC